MNTDYRVVITDEAAQDLKNCIDYLVNAKKTTQAAISLLDDFDDTIATLSIVAGSLKLCESPNMKARGLKKLYFLRHDYFMVFLVEKQTAYVTNIFHELEDADNKIK